MRLILSSTNLMDNKRPSKGDLLILNSAQRKSLDAMIVDPSMVTYHFSSGELRVNYQSKDISDSEILLVRRTKNAELESYQLAKAMESRGKVVVDPSLSLIYPVSKFPSQVLRTEYTPKTIFASDFSEQTLEGIANNLGFPLVIKPSGGTKGRGFKVAENREEVKDYLNGKTSWMIFQEYLDITSLMRVLTIDGKVTNASYCAGTKKFSGIDVAKEITQKIVANNPSKILGTDVVKTKEGKYYVLECNRNPDYTLLGDIFAEKVVNYLINLTNVGR